MDPSFPSAGEVERAKAHVEEKIRCWQGDMQIARFKTFPPFMAGQ
jgi:hypothetical protein